ncbi:hypothetical protein D9619_010535 [Psilocybe cf. subviscida]|uniref:Ribonucleoside-diphosphate reductase n=1 Tax=Psilocybe cf. subviscida TaxID=2480587 RepID=A0A8H5AQX6_9AGAR|nr:hypothetical protein D9619_013548 [Psilocybe cf. subviscida]KAF5310087.1 hypothetical protein D9619_010535 [Psilocybe cf. subviscida]
MPNIVIKRDGRRQPYDRAKILKMLQTLLKPEHKHAIDLNLILTKVESSIPSEIKASSLEDIVAEKTATLAFLNPEYDTFAGRIALATLYRRTPSSFSHACAALASGRDPVLTQRFTDDVQAHRQYLDVLAQHSTVFAYPFTAIKLMKRELLLRNDDEVVERPAYMYLRVAVHIHGKDVTAVTRTFHQLTHHFYFLDTAMLANAGTHVDHLVSQYTFSPAAPHNSRSLYYSLAQCAAITDTGGQMGINFGSLPCSGAPNDANNSGGLVPVLDLFTSSLYVGVGANPQDHPAMSGYIQIWRQDIFKVIELIRCNDCKTHSGEGIHYVISVPDNHNSMMRVRENAGWSLMCPSETPYLDESYGTTFDAIYTAYEADNRIDKNVVDAVSLMNAITRCQAETGQPSIVFRDAVNVKNSQKHLGIITHGGHSTGIVQYSSLNQTGVTQLASIILPLLVKNNAFDFGDLYTTVTCLTVILNLAIDKSSYPTVHAARGAHRQRALGIGIHGLADTFIMLNMVYDSPEAKELNYRISQTMYHASLSASNRYAQIRGCYPDYAGSPMAEGLLNPDLWHHGDDNRNLEWQSLRERISTFGVANSLLICFGPTPHLSNIVGFTTGFDPIKSNIIVRRDPSASYALFSSALVIRLRRLNLWNDNVKEHILRSRGSVQEISELPDQIKAVFKTAWELGPMPVIQLAADRSPYICHAQAISAYVTYPSMVKIQEVLFLTWKAGLKTGIHKVITAFKGPPPAPNSSRCSHGSSPSPSTSHPLSSTSSQSLPDLVDIYESDGHQDNSSHQDERRVRFSRGDEVIALH